MLVTNLVGRKARLVGGGGRGPNTHYGYEIVGVYIDDGGVPCVIILGRDGIPVWHLANHIQVKENAS